VDLLHPDQEEEDQIEMLLLHLNHPVVDREEEGTRANKSTNIAKVVEIVNAHHSP
jgi:hypothetical protein